MGFFLSNCEYNQLGRLWVIWRSTVRMAPIYKSDQMNTCSVLMPGSKEEFFCSFIFAVNTVRRGKAYGKM